jgi:L-aminopeptidase/D-esterase-like protein
MKTLTVILTETPERELEVKRLKEDVETTLNRLVKKYGNNRNGHYLSIFATSYITTMALTLCYKDEEFEILKAIIESSGLMQKNNGMED